MKSNKLRYFRAEYERTENATGIGIAEKLNAISNETIAIQSIYMDKRISNYDVQTDIYKTIRYALDDGERARILINKFYRGNGTHDAYKSRISVKHVPRIKGITYEAHLLAMDAIKRGTTIKETFDNPLYFSVVKQEREEKGANEN